MPRQRQPLLGFGIILLANRIFQTGFKHIPPVTLLAVLVQAALYIGIINPPWDRHEVCLSAEAILYYEDYRRLFLSAIEHADDFHLYHNMASLIIKGRTLESRNGSLKYFIILVIFIFSTSGVYIALAKGLYMYTDDYGYMKQCAIGFSGVLFAMKVLTSFDSRYEEQVVHGFVVPSKYAVWVELLIIHVLVPRASFIGHLAGILVGILYIQGFLRVIVDTLHHFIQGTLFFGNQRSGGGHFRSYTYDHGSTGFSQNSSGYRAPNYGWNEDHIADEPLSPEELRRRRTQRFS